MDAVIPFIKVNDFDHGMDVLAQNRSGSVKKNSGGTVLHNDSVKQRKRLFSRDTNSSIIFVFHKKYFESKRVLLP